MNKKLINNIKAIIIKFGNKLSCFNRRCSTGQAPKQNPKAEQVRYGAGKYATGQVMLLSVLILGGSILGASTIAGYLMILKVRGSSDITNSTKAIYAADTGIEWELYKQFKDSDYTKPSLSNGASFNTVIEGQGAKSVGESSNNFRAFQVGFSGATSTTP